MADKITSQTRNVYNEFVIERTEWRTNINSKYSGIQPDYVVIFADWDSKLKENALKAASDFEPSLQIIYIDKNKVAKNESRKIEDKLTKFDADPENIQLFVEALDLHESNRTGFGHSQNVFDIDEIFSTDRIMDSFDDFIVNIDKLYRNNKNVPSVREKIVNILTKMCDILRDEKKKFELGEFHVHSKTVLDLDIDDMIDYLEGYIDDFKENVW